MIEVQAMRGWRYRLVIAAMAVVLFLVGFQALRSSGDSPSSGDDPDTHINEEALEHLEKTFEECGENLENCIVIETVVVEID